MYTEVCQSCHQLSGKGLGKSYPPLVGSEWLKKSDDVLIRILLHGLEGKITVAGKEYGSMAMANNNLTDTQIADVLSFTRSHFGKFEQPVSADKVKSIRDQYPDGHAAWTMVTLQPFDKPAAAETSSKTEAGKTPTKSK